MDPNEYGARGENDERCAQFCNLLASEQDRLEFVQVNSWCVCDFNQGNGGYDQLNVSNSDVEETTE